MRDEDMITFDELYRQTALKALNRAGTVAGAAQLLGISTRTLVRWKKTYGIKREADTFFIKPNRGKRLNERS